MVIITGASKGLGKFIFEKFYSINQNEVLGTFLSTMPEEKYKNELYKIDISDINSVAKWIDSISEKLNNITLINNAGITYNCFAHKSEPDLWYKVIETNLLGSYNLIRYLLPYMRAQNYGRIINISSVVAQKGPMGNSAYAASKSALWGMSKVIANENAKFNITSNNINLGYMNIGLIEQIPDNIKENIRNDIPLSRFGEPKEVFDTIEYIIQNDYLTGTSIDLNGGLF